MPGIRDKDPVEEIVAEGLRRAEIEFRVDDNVSGLDFYLPGLDVYIEVKQHHSARIAEQMSRRPNVIAVQGMHAARKFVEMITGDVFQKYTGAHGPTLRAVPLK